jgi:hypothetical protein
MLCGFFRLFPISGVDGRLTATGLLSMINWLHPCPAKKRYGGLTDVGEKEVNGTRDEEGYDFHRETLPLLHTEFR